MSADYETNVEWLHIYPQSCWHDDVSIVGTRKGLESLRDALTAALASDKGVAAAQCFVTDGEGYAAGIHCVPFNEMERMRTPYVDEVAASKDGMRPRDLPFQPRL